LIGLELNISILSAALRGEPTGCTVDFCGDVVATAKQNLTAGEFLDGEGGYTVWGKLMPARDSLALGALPIGLANNVKVRHDIPAGQLVRWTDVDRDHAPEALQVRQAMEKAYRDQWHLCN
jgi:predicted homoserine dehydrogenase-like protein